MLRNECFIQSIKKIDSDVLHISMTSYTKLTSKAVGETTLGEG
jgi:hypothetical protein